MKYSLFFMVGWFIGDLFRYSMGWFKPENFLGMTAVGVVFALAWGLFVKYVICPRE